ncbi:MAG: epoxyqueuosine reductase [Lentisphaeria bacterium]|jgi:epoxyqueuosine reductase
MTQQKTLTDLAEHIDTWGRELGFQQIGIAKADVSSEQERLDAWLAAGHHGSMLWMETHKDLRINPQKLLPGTTRVISARMDYLPPETQQIAILKSPEKAYISRYALGRDYHKLIRKRLAILAANIEAYCKEHASDLTLTQRPFVDSAPVMERPLAESAGLGWVGKHTLLINEHAGSWFFLGEIYTNVPLPTAEHKQKNRCGDCKACLKVCPTDAFPSPYQLDARRCISYLTVEHKGAIAEEFREAMGNRVFGCDDCQAICPWNKFASATCEDDFKPRHGLESSELITLFLWTEEEFLQKTAGSPIRRIGFERWLRNLSIGLGNAPTSPSIIDALKTRLKTADGFLKEHFSWALLRQQSPSTKRKRKIKR